MPDHPNYAPDDPAAVECYRAAMRALGAVGVEFLVGGAYSFARYTDVIRHTKDFDVFLRPADRDPALAALAAAGYRTEVTYPHWLAKAFNGPYFIDLIYGSGNGLCVVDDGWFAHATDAEVLGEPARLCPAEESLWSKAFIMERNRYDGADVAHILRARGQQLDWKRLLRRFGPHWRVLYSHLFLFGFIYPGERQQVPAWVLRELGRRLQDEQDAPAPTERVCHGTVLAAAEYLIDVGQWDYRDARLEPRGNLTPEQIATWTEGVLTGR